MPLADYLARSRASEQLKHDVRALAAVHWGGIPNTATITSVRYAPAVKVVRVLTQLFSELPDCPIERIEVDARSGCSDYVGTVTVHVGDTARVFDFAWDCRWRAAEAGWVDHWGEPDQVRAAREFDWRCFATWAERTGQPARRGPRISHHV